MGSERGRGHGDRPIRLTSSRERLYVVLEVRDEGCGMTKAEQKKIFEPFYSSKNSNTSWGMGLYHVRTIVRAHVGSLRVESKPGGNILLRASAQICAGQVMK